VTDRVEQGEPELLGILLIPPNLHHGELARRPRAVGPGAQQRPLPAAGRSRDEIARQSLSWVDHVTGRQQSSLICGEDHGGLSTDRE
jgi:hypothetical protein